MNDIFSLKIDKNFIIILKNGKEFLRVSKNDHNLEMLRILYNLRY